MPPCRCASAVGILANVQALAQRQAAVETRTPVIPGYNDAPEHLAAIARMRALHQFLAEIYPHTMLSSD